MLGSWLDGHPAASADASWTESRAPPPGHPPAGQPEPLALDDGRKPLTLLHQCCVEQRVVDEEAGTDLSLIHI